VHSTLVIDDRGDELHIVDRRVGRPERDHVIAEPWEIAAYRALADGLGPASIVRTLTKAGVAVPDEAAVQDWLDRLLLDGLVFHDAGRYVALATADVPARVPVADRG
jgi:hypothetical protein